MNLSLPHQARRVDPYEARDNQSEPFRRARDEEVVVDPGDAVGRATVIVGDGEPHDVVLVEDEKGHVGYCDCDGFAFHEGDLAGDCCTHIVAFAMQGALDQALIKTLDEVLDVDQDDAGDEQDQGDDAGDANPDGSDDDDLPTEVQRRGGYADRPDDQEPSADPPDRADHGGGPTPAQLDNPFAGALEDVDKRFVMTLDGDPYIKREGWQRLARSEGFRLRRNMVTLQSETDSTLAECEAWVVDEDGEVVAEATGTAHVEGEDMKDAVANLNELAETRAYSRALGWATGAGLSAVEVDAAAEYDDIATDGGVQ